MVPERNKNKKNTLHFWEDCVAPLVTTPQGCSHRCLLLSPGDWAPASTPYQEVKGPMRPPTNVTDWVRGQETEVGPQLLPGLLLITGAWEEPRIRDSWGLHGYPQSAAVHLPCFSLLTSLDRGCRLLKTERAWCQLGTTVRI